ncbi:MAG TPA: hypothetical protein VD866_04865 [Urbifossiella sp.]|nr:hypothetical protein [Urbifossiella sp.]
MFTSLLHGRLRGWLVLVALTLPLAWVSLAALYADLNARAKARVLRSPGEFDPGTGVVRAFDAKGVVIFRDVRGVPLLATLPLPGDAAPLPGAVTRTLLGRYAVRLEPAAPPAPTPSATPPADTAPAAPPPAAAPPKPYRPDHLLLEVVLEENENGEWRVAADLGYQAEPNVWARVPWWKKDGIAPSNELLRVDRHRRIPFLFSITTPTTIEALAAFLREHWVGTAKALNPDYAAAPLAVKPRDFEKLVVHPLMSVLPADFSSVPVLTQVFVFNTLNGELQLLMLLNLEMGLLVLLVRYVRLVALARWSPAPAAAVRAAATGRYVSAELGSWIVFWGLLGTLVFLALAVVQLRISASSAVMM